MAFGGLSQSEREQQERCWWRTLVGRVFGSERAAHPQFEDFFGALYEHYADASAWRVFDDVWPLLETARKRNVAIWVVSNFDTRLHNVLDGLQLTDAVDGVLCSSEAGAAKPSIKIFRQALQELGTAAEDTLHIGDDPEADYRGAIDAGMQALWLKRNLAAAERIAPGAQIREDMIEELSAVTARL